MKNELFNFFKKNIWIILLTFLTLQSSFLFQRGESDIYNSYIGLKKNEFSHYMISVKDEIGFFEENEKKLYRANEPLMFRSEIIKSNNIEYTLLESWPMNNKDQDSSPNMLFQKIYSWYGQLENFEKDYKAGLSVELYHKLFPNKEPSDFYGLTFPISCGHEIIEAEIAFLYDGNKFDNITNNGKLYKSIYGINYLFVNKNIANKIDFKQLNVVYNQNNYTNFFNRIFFKSFNSSEIIYYDYFHETNELINYNLLLQERILIFRIFCFFLMGCYPYILNFLKKKKELFLSYKVFGISYSCSILIFVILQKLIKKSIFISPCGFWFVFLVGVFSIFATIFLNKKQENRGELCD